jgi:alpha-tubulin suppressor-like RCC1 family protein
MEQGKRSAACSKAHNGMAARGQHTTDDSTGSEKKLIQAARRVVDIACGASHSLFLLEDGSLWTCGSNRDGQLGQSLTVPEVHTPIRIESMLVKVRSVQSGPPTTNPLRS